MSEKGVLRIFRHMRGKVTGRLGKVYDEKFHNFSLHQIMEDEIGRDGEDEKCINRFGWKV
jgi:hypothetical protein